MRQAQDPHYAALLSWVRMQEPTDEDIETLRSDIGITLPNMDSVLLLSRANCPKTSDEYEEATRRGGQIEYLDCHATVLRTLQNRRT
jgi:hypothetical protein